MIGGKKNALSEWKKNAPGKENFPPYGMAMFKCIFLVNETSVLALPWFAGIAQLRSVEKCNSLISTSKKITSTKTEKIQKMTEIEGNFQRRFTF